MCNEPFKDIQVCCSCGKEFSVSSGDIEFGPDPFAEDVHNDPTPVWECEDCRYESAMDI